ncbi:ShlB/FhaC/HecB family hemolysin secretion/activation protein [Sandarakinorhabdus sp.]|uniref:ShlB/FhaC/HecB family hemolysin secretion/activation protein n=1 Tax=Sandarakinorhabdus sp. TaxID=1916663 RepID=UPI00286DBBFB|nr:ShlB/FhaC/HecB family hemolysin secretion/activation protein [Sandarakinorhabdus sp.]
MAVASAAVASAQEQAPQVEAPQAQVPPVRSAPDQFEISAFDVVGVTRLDAATVEAAVYPFAGPGRAATDVEAARKALEAAYKAKGYESVLVEIPPQPNAAFVAGIVLLKVTEAVVGQVRVVGSKYHAPTVVLAQVPALQPGVVPDFSAAQKQLAAANRFPDREITPSIKAGKIPGTIDIDLRVRDTLPLHASLELTNDHNNGTEPLRLAGSVRYTNLWQAGHTITASYLVAPQNRDQVEVISGSYLAPLLGSRWTMLLYGYTSKSNVAALGGSQVLGNGYAVGARAIYRVPGDVEQALTFGFDWKDFKQDILVPTGPDTPPGLIQTPISYVPLVISYNRQSVSANSALNLTVGVTAGLRGFGSRATDVQTQRFNAVGNFVHLNFDGDYTRSLGGDYSAFVRLTGQFSDSPLVNNEQFSIGGNSSVRGYFQSEAVGDDGVNASFELRSRSFGSNLGRFVDELRLFGFVDGGFVRVRSPLPDQQSEFSLLSAGAGARFQLLRYLKGNLAYGWTLVDGVVRRAGDGMLTFSVKGEF